MTELLLWVKACFAMLAVLVVCVLLIVAKVDQIRTKIFGHNPDKPISR
jgi:hypothetical protein